MINLCDIRRIRNVVCLGAHCDDIEIGCGGTILRLAKENPDLHVRWVVFGGADERRAAEAERSAGRFLEGVRSKEVQVAPFLDAYMPFMGAEVKDYFESLKKSGPAPDVVFTHYREDRHQDHRLLSDLAWNTWRDHLVLEYEIIKYDGDLGRPNLYSPLGEELCRRKVELIMAGFPSQAGRQWFTEDTFWAMLRMRGVECNSPSRFAEAFYARKLLL
jgi:LmbE family N-acetylglucosaminyl deacetylase